MRHATPPIRIDPRRSAPVGWRRSSLPTPMIGPTKLLMQARFVARLPAQRDLD
jgi:hypothetical protein